LDADFDPVGKNAKNSAIKSYGLNTFAYSKKNSFLQIFRSNAYKTAQTNEKHNL
jgi:hypothetical protein